MNMRSAPDFALSFSSDAVHLLERAAAPGQRSRWTEISVAAFDAPDFRAEMARLRRLAANGPDARVALIIPEDQILYTSLPAGAAPDEDLGRALDGLTPYPVAELSWDWRPEDRGRMRVAAVARQTLREAEDFARSHGFAAAGFLGDPAEGKFPAIPRFSDAPVPTGATGPHLRRAGAGDLDLSGDLVETPQPATAAEDAAGIARDEAAPDPADDALPPEARGDTVRDVSSDAATCPGDAAPVMTAGTTAVEAGEADVPEPAGKAGNGTKPSGVSADGTTVTLSPRPAAPALATSAGVATAVSAAATPGKAAATPSRPEVTAFLPDDFAAAQVGQAQPVQAPPPPPSDLIAEHDSPVLPPVPAELSPRAKAVLDRAAAARLARDDAATTLPERHPGARGGVGALLVMLGALLLGLTLIWAFATPSPRGGGSPDLAAVPAAPAPDQSAPRAIETDSAPAAAASAPPPALAAPAAATATVTTPAAPVAEEPQATATASPAGDMQAPITAAPAVQGPAVQLSATAAPAGNTASPTASGGAVATAGADAPVTAAVADSDAATAPADPQPASTTAPAAGALPASDAASGAAVAADAPATTQDLPTTATAATIPTATTPTATAPAAERPSIAPRRPEPAAAPVAATADQLPAVVPGRSAVTRSKRPSSRPATVRRQAAPLATAPAATTAPAAVRATTSQPARPAQTAAPAAPRPPAAARPPARRTAPTAAPVVAPAATATPRPSSARPAPRPEEGSANEDATPAEMTAAEAAAADVLLADLYAFNPALRRLSVPSAERGPAYAQARPARRPGTATTAVDAALSEAVAAKPAQSPAVQAPARAVAAANRPNPRPGRAGGSQAAVANALAEAVASANPASGRPLVSAGVPLRKPARAAAALAPARDSEAEAVAIAAAAAMRPVAPLPSPPRPQATPPAAAAAPPAATEPPAVDAAQRARDEALQRQAEERARASAQSDAQAEAQARAQADARARAQAEAERQAAIASQGSYRPPEVDDEPEIAQKPAQGTTAGDVARNATQRGFESGKTQVIGVIGAGRASRGLIRLRNGRIVTVRIGDKIDGGAINRIGDGKITYVKGGRTYNLPIMNGR